MRNFLAVQHHFKFNEWRPIAGTIAVILFGGTTGASADTTLNVSSVADTYLNSDPTFANRDLSNFGDMEISANLPDPVQGVNYARTMDAVVAYDTTAIKAGFDAEYGLGNWHVTDVQVEWYSNYDIIGTPANNTQFNVPAAGAFNISLLADNSWFDPATAGGPGLANTDFNWDSVFTAGGAYNNLLSGEQTLGTYNYTGGSFNGGNNCANVSCDPRFWDLGANTGLFNTIQSGGLVSLFGSAADSNISYLINQRGAAGAQPQIFVSAAAGAAPTSVPIPAAGWLFASLSLPILGFSIRNRKGDV
jgi:hypothetical protein